MTNQQQLELGLAGVNRNPGNHAAPQRQPQFSRATWWFDQMRQVVDRALDWEPAPRFQPRQILLAENQPR